LTRARNNLPATMMLLAAGAFVVVLLAGWVGGKGFVRRIGTLSPGYLLLALCVEICFMLLGTLRWSIIIRAQGGRIPRELLAISFSGAFLNNITPVSRTGGEPVRAYMLSRANGTTFEEAMATVVADRVFDMVPFVLICLVSFALITAFGVAPGPLVLGLMLLGLVAAAVLSTILIVASLRKEAGVKLVLLVVGRLEPFVRRFRPGHDIKAGTLQVLERFYRGTRSIAGRRSVLARGTLISFILWLTIILRLKIVFLSVGSDLPLIIVNVVAVASTFSGFAPLLPGGLGATEATMIALFVGFGTPNDVAATAVLVDRVVSYWFVTAIGALTSVRLSLKLRDVER